MKKVKMEKDVIIKMIGKRKFFNLEKLTAKDYDKLYEYFSNQGEMPYGTMKARTGDPEEWMYKKLVSLGGT